jgi:2'-5' RNA ligase
MKWINNMFGCEEKKSKGMFQHNGALVADKADILLVLLTNCASENPFRINLTTVGVKPDMTINGVMTKNVCQTEKLVKLQHQNHCHIYGD